MPSIELFTPTTPGYYLISQIYNSVTNPTGNICPQPGSLVLDNNVLKYVKSIDTTTHNSNLVVASTSLLRLDTLEESTDGTSIIDYGNSRFHVYYNSNEVPIKLTIDKNLFIIGKDARYYELYYLNTSSEELVPISIYYEDNGTLNGIRIPLLNCSINSVNVMVPTNCHTSHFMTDNMQIVMILFDYSGTQCGTIKLYSKKALINNTADDTRIITDFKIKSTQQIDDNTSYIYPDQDPSTLVLSPYVYYNDGSSAKINIDNEVCHIYGLEGFTAAYSGQSIEVQIKYFLEDSQQAVSNQLVVTQNSRALVRNMNLNVINSLNNSFVFKILTVPIYVNSSSRWILTFFLYCLTDNTVRDITNYVSVSPTFDGILYGSNQELTLSFDIHDVFTNADDYTYQQPVVLTMSPVSYYERFIVRDTLGDTYGIYGADAPLTPRPVIYYNSTTCTYTISSSRFTSKAQFLESFYYKNRPLCEANTSTPRTPTHFTIRNSTTGNILLTTPIAIDNYTTELGLTIDIFKNSQVGINCIVEFLLQEGSQFITLYGSVVDIYDQTQI